MKEAFNQCVHLFIGFLLGCCMTEYTKNLFSIMAFVLCCAVIIEVFQYFFNDKRQLFLEDRLFDISSYLLGSVLSMAMLL